MSLYGVSTNPHLHQYTVTYQRDAVKFFNLNSIQSQCNEVHCSSPSRTRLQRSTAAQLRAAVLREVYSFPPRSPARSPAHPPVIYSVTRAVGIEARAADGLQRVTCAARRDAASHKRACSAWHARVSYGERGKKSDSGSTKAAEPAIAAPGPPRVAKMPGSPPTARSRLARRLRRRREGGAAWPRRRRRTGDGDRGRRGR